MNPSRDTIPVTHQGTLLILKRLVIVAILLLPYAYVGVLLATVIHEVIGHGLVAWCTGAKFIGFQLSLNGMGYASILDTSDSANLSLVLGLGGVVASTVVGMMLLGFACVLRRNPPLALLLLALAFGCLLEGTSYTCWNAFHPVPPGDIGVILQATNSPLLRYSLFLAGGIFMAVSIWILTALIFQILEQWISVNGLLRGRSRFAVLLGLGVIPAALWFFFDWNQLAPGIGLTPNYVAVGLHLFSALSLYRIRFQPKPVIPSVRSVVWSIATGWILLLVTIIAVQLWLQKGLYWS